MHLTFINNLYFRKISNDLIGLNLFQPSSADLPTPNPVQQYSSLNSPTLSLTNKSISPPNPFTTVSKYAAGNRH